MSMFGILHFKRLRRSWKLGSWARVWSCRSVKPSDILLVRSDWLSHFELFHLVGGRIRQSYITSCQTAFSCKPSHPSQTPVSMFLMSAFVAILVLQSWDRRRMETWCQWRAPGEACTTLVLKHASLYLEGNWLDFENEILQNLDRPVMEQIIGAAKGRLSSVAYLVTI